MNWFTCFWVPYFYYDAWAMYKVYTAKAENIKDCSTVMSKVKSFFKSEPLMLAHHFFLPSLFGFGVLVSGYDIAVGVVHMLFVIICSLWLCSLCDLVVSVIL